MRVKTLFEWDTYKTGDGNLAHFSFVNGILKQIYIIKYVSVEIALVPQLRLGYDRPLFYFLSVLQVNDVCPMS